MGRFKVHGWWLLALAALTLFGMGSTASAATKPYSLMICALGTSETCAPSPTSSANQPAGVPAGASNIPMTAAFLNENKVGTGINLGSANLTAPAGFTVNGASLGGSALAACAPSTPASTSCLNGNVIELRSLGLVPGAAMTLNMTVASPTTIAACTVASPCGWSVLAKQSNDFSGAPGNDLSLDPSTSTLNTVLAQLQFGQEPHHTALGGAITDSDYNPLPPSGTGGPVTVEVADANGTPVRSYDGTVSLTLTTPNNGFTNPFPATLGGTTQVPGGVAQNAMGGVATFKDLTVSESGNGFALTASTSASDMLTSTTSTLFDVQQAGAQCKTNKSCRTDASSANFANIDHGVDATVTATFGQSTNLSESIDFGEHLFATQCEGYDATHDVYWNFAATTGTVTVSITTTVLSGNITGSMINGQDNCLAAPKRFLEVNESTNPPSLTPAPQATAPAPPDGTLPFSGLLPDCGTKKGQVSPTSGGALGDGNPCVLSRSGTSNPSGGGTLTITISVPASLGDMTSRG